MIDELRIRTSRYLSTKYIRNLHICLMVAFSVFPFFSQSASCQHNDILKRKNRNENKNKNCAAYGRIEFRQPQRPQSVFFDQSAKAIISIDINGKVVSWNALTGKKKASSIFPNSRLLVPSADRRYWIVVPKNGFEIRVFDSLRRVVKSRYKTDSEISNIASASPNLKHFAVACESGNQLHIWDLESGTTKKLNYTDGTISAIAITPNGKNAITGMADGSILFWDIRSGQHKKLNGNHEDTIWSLAISPSGKYFASAGGDQVIRVWEIKSQDMICKFDSESGTVRALQFSPKNDFLASGGTQNGVILWEFNTGKKIRVLGGIDEGISSIDFSADGHLLAYAGHVIRCWSTRSGEEQTRLDSHTDLITSLSISSESKCVLTASKDSSTRMWDFVTGQHVRVFSGDGFAIRCAEFSPRNRVVAAGCDSGNIVLWDRRTGKRVARLVGHKGSVRAIAFSRDGRWLISGGLDATVRVWDLHSLQQLKVLHGHYGRVQSVAFMNDLATVISASNDGNITFWNWKSAKKIHTADIGCHEFRLSKDERTMAILQNGTGVVAIDMATRKQIVQFDAGLPTCIDYCGPLLLAIGQKNGEIRIFDIPTSKLVHVIKGSFGAVTAIRTSSDNHNLVAAYADTVARRWRIGGKNLKVRMPKKIVTQPFIRMCWVDLGSTDLRKVYSAVRKLQSFSDLSIAWFENEIRPIQSPPMKQVQDLIVQLDSSKSDVRSRAKKRLENYGDTIRAIVTENLQGELSLEQQTRLKQILAKMNESPPLSRLRLLRAIHVAELIGTTKAIAFLKTMAGGAESSIVTRRAGTSLVRVVEIRKRLAPK